METRMEESSLGSTPRTVSRPASRKANYIPWIAALIFGVLWSLVYLVLGRMHGMWPMFNSEFPFSTVRLFTSQIAELPTVLGALFAFVDGSVVGLAASWIILLAARITSRIGS